MTIFTFILFVSIAIVVVSYAYYRKIQLRSRQEADELSSSFADERRRRSY